MPYTPATVFADGTVMVSSAVVAEPDRIRAWLNGGMQAADFDGVVYSHHLPRSNFVGAPVNSMRGQFHDALSGRVIVGDAARVDQQPERLDLFPAGLDVNLSQRIPPLMGSFALDQGQATRVYAQAWVQMTELTEINTVAVAADYEYPNQIGTLALCFRQRGFAPLGPVKRQTCAVYNTWDAVNGTSTGSRWYALEGYADLTGHSGEMDVWVEFRSTGKWQQLVISKRGMSVTLYKDF